jgi:sterol desaturase/sphingolipid hydroxylase (fatty acid hydroxylase superfamily)
MGIIQASIPLFFLLLTLELVWSQLSGKRLLRLNDALSDISCGIMSQMAGIFDKAITLGVFIWISTNASVQQLGPSVPAWIARAPFAGGGSGVDVWALLSWSVVFVLVDCCYYWSHRLSHEVNVLWAGHVVHHQSEEYNLAVALRQATIGKLMTWVFYVPLALLGVPWRMFVTAYGINLVYQFVLHTRAVGKLWGPVEWVMNTPSHHRVHHGVNPKYQDRNYGGVFIVFDRLFGTFQVEEEAVVYGTTKPLRRWNPIAANLQVFAQIWRDARRATRWSDRLRIVFGRPGWRPAELGAPEVPRPVSADTFVKYDPPLPAPLATYGFVQFAVATVAAVLLLRRAATLPVGQSAAAAFFIVVALAGVGGIFERAKWARPLETARLVALAMAGAIIATVAPALAGIAWSGVALALVSLVVLWRYRQALTELALSPVM